MNQLGLLPSIEDSYRRRIIIDLQGLSGARFERFGYPLIDKICVSTVMLPRGLNPEGAPVKTVIDNISADTSVAAQYSSEASYFAGDAHKPKADYSKVRARHPSAKTIHLLSNDVAPVNFTGFLEWVKNRSATDGVKVETWDAMRIADFLIDQLHDEPFCNTISEFMRCIEIFRSEYAFSQLLPRLRPEYVRRPEEADLRELIEQQRITIVHGLSGTGKSDLCCAVAWGLKPKFEAVAWLDARDLKRVEDLGSISLHRFGAPQSLLGFLQRQRVLLVLDNVESSLELRSFDAWLQNGSRILITQKTSELGGLKLEGMRPEEAREILLNGNEPCPEAIFDRIFQSTGGHALTLSLVGRLSRRYGWAELNSDTLEIGNLYDPSSRDNLRQRVLGRVEALVSTELDFLRWSGTADLDRALVSHVLGVGSVANLNDLNLLTRSTDDVVSFHEIIANFANSTSADGTRATNFKTMFIAYLQRSALPKQAPFFACVHRHIALINRLIGEGEKAPALLYSAFSANDPGNVAQQCVKDPAGFVSEIMDGHPHVPMKLRCLTVVEAMEREYLRLITSQKDAAKEFALHSVATFDELLSKPMEQDDQALLLHHKAKALNRADKRDEAEKLYRDILAGPKPLNQSRLQLARILERRDEGAKAADLIREVLRIARTDPESVPTTIVLEVFGTLRHGSLLPFRDEFAREFSDIAVTHLEKTITTGFEQPYFALASLASFWSENDAAQLLRLFKELPVPPASLLRNDSGRAAVAEVYLHVAELLQSDVPDTADSLRSQVIEEMMKVRSNSFYDHLRVRALLGRREYGDAEQILRARSGDGNVWHFVWLACALDGQGRSDEAAYTVATAKALATEKGLRLWMVESRCRVLFGLSNQPSVRVDTGLAT